MSGNTTQINNNQITNAVNGNTYLGINASTKIQPNSITAELLSNSITVVTTGNVSANYFAGNGSQLTGVIAVSVTGNVANANYANYAGTANIAITAGYYKCRYIS